jgi:hypothetical protein
MKRFTAVKIPHELKDACEACGATVEDDTVDEWITLICVAPDGFIWRETGGYHLLVQWERGQSSDDAVHDAKVRIAIGIEPEDT